MFCPNCGSKTEEDACFCGECGCCLQKMDIEKEGVRKKKDGISGEAANRKKKKAVLIILGFLVSIGLVWAGLDWISDSPSGTFEDISEKLRGDDDRDTSIYVGETAESEAMRISITDIGHCYLTYDGLFSMELDDNGSRLLYIVCNIENLSNQVLEVDSDLFDVYIGSAKCPVFTYCALPDENFHPTNRSGSLIPGAEMQLIFSTLLSKSYDNTVNGDLNVMFGNLIIPIADESGWKTTNYRLQPYIDAYNNPESSDLITANTPVPEADIDFSSEPSIPDPLIYGTYVYDNGVSAVSKAYIGFGTEDEELINSVFIDCWGYGDHEIISFTGTLEENEDGSYYAYDEGFDTGIKIRIADGGLYVEIINSAVDLMHELEGFYILEEELNVNEVS